MEENADNEVEFSRRLKAKLTYIMSPENAPFDINGYMHCNRVEGWPFYRVKRIECKDGFSISVQASESAYCSPRINLADLYTSVECGFPSKASRLLSPYQERWKRRPQSQCVFPYVPVEVVEKLIVSHGGVK